MEIGRGDARGAARWSDEVGPGGREEQELSSRARAGAVEAINGSESVRMDRERPGSAEPGGWEPGVPGAWADARAARGCAEGRGSRSLQ